MLNKFIKWLTDLLQTDKAIRKLEHEITELKLEKEKLKETNKLKDKEIEELNETININKITIEEQYASISNLKALSQEFIPDDTTTLVLTKDGSQHIKTVSKELLLSKNFKVKEFMQKDGLEFIKIDQRIIDALQKIREHYNKPITITSGYRSVAYNKQIGGSTKSQHILGKAVDFKVKDISIANVQKYIYNNWEELGIRGLETSAKTWVHIDVRENDKLITF